MHKDDTTKPWISFGPAPHAGDPTRRVRHRPQSSADMPIDQTTRFWPEAAEPHVPSPLPSGSTNKQRQFAGRPVSRLRVRRTAPGDIVCALLSGIIAFLVVGAIWGWPTFEADSPDFLSAWCIRHAIKFVAIECMVIVPYVLLSSGQSRV